MVKNKNRHPRNSKGQGHGYWENYYGNGLLHYKGHYNNGNAYGLWEEYHYDGTLWYKEYYNNVGNVEGIEINE